MDKKSSPAAEAREQASKQASEQARTQQTNKLRPLGLLPESPSAFIALQGLPQEACHYKKVLTHEYSKCPSGLSPRGLPKPFRGVTLRAF